MRSGVFALIFSSLASTACAREVAVGLDEADANRGVVALARAGVDAEKLPDPQAEGRFRLSVGRDEATIAISVLAAEELPRAKAQAAQPSLLPTPEAERAARIASMAASVERTLSSIDGVHDARVHLDVPAADPLVAALGPEAKTPKATASVLLRHRGVNPPLSIEDVKRLVAGAVSGLTVEAVAVVTSAIPQPTIAGDRELAHLGPIAVTRGSLGALRAVLAGGLVVVALLSVALLALAARVRRLRDEALPADGGAR